MARKVIHKLCPCCGCEAEGRGFDFDHVTVGCTNQKCRLRVLEPIMPFKVIPKRHRLIAKHRWSIFMDRIRAEAIDRAWKRWDTRKKVA